MMSEEIKQRKDSMERMASDMTLDELRGAPGVGGVCLWLAEIAYQLAKRNEGPMGARMEKLLRAYAADDPCAPNDPRYKEAVEILAAIDQQSGGPHD